MSATCSVVRRVVCPVTIASARLFARIHMQDHEARDERIVAHGIDGYPLLPLAHPLVLFGRQRDRAVAHVRDLEAVRSLLRARARGRARERED